MDSERLKRLDRLLGTPLIVTVAAWERLLLALSAKRRARGAPAAGGKEAPGLSGLRRIAVVKTVAIGDLVVAMPTLAALRDRFAEAHITLVTTPRVRAVVEGCPWVDDILYFDVFGAHRGLLGLIRFVGELRRRRFDAWIELEHYYRSTTLLGYLCGARVRVGFDIPGQVRGRLFTLKVHYPTEAHELDAFYSIARAVGVTRPPSGLLPLPVSPEDEEAVTAWLSDEGVSAERELVVLHTTTSPVAVARRWLDDRWIELAERLFEGCGLMSVLTGAPDDAPGLRALASRAKVPMLVAAGRLTLRQFASLALRAKLVVSLDTGPLHVAAAMGTPTVGLFGPNTPAKWGPYGPLHRAVWAGLDCAPCTKQYLGLVSSCARDDCMRAITVEDVLSAVEVLPSRPCPAGLSLRQAPPLA